VSEMLPQTAMDPSPWERGGRAIEARPNALPLASGGCRRASPGEGREQQTMRAQVVGWGVGLVVLPRLPRRKRPRRGEGSRWLSWPSSCSPPKPQFLQRGGDGRVEMTLTTASHRRQAGPGWHSCTRLSRGRRAYTGSSRPSVSRSHMIAQGAHREWRPGRVGLKALVSALANRRLGSRLASCGRLPRARLLAVARAAGKASPTTKTRRWNSLQARISRTARRFGRGRRALAPLRSPSFTWRRSAWVGFAGTSSALGRSPRGMEERRRPARRTSPSRGRRW